MKYFTITVLMLISILSITLITFVGCGVTNSQPVEKTQYMLGTVCTIKVYDKSKEKAIDKAFDRIRDIENKMSVNKEGTELDAVADAAGKNFVKVSKDTFDVLKKGKYYCEESKGAFDITIGPLVKLWGIGTDKATVPSQKDIDSTKALINYKDLILDDKDNKVMLKRSGMSLDLGGIAKGYSADEAARVLKENGVSHAVINLGGNVLVINDNPYGHLWKVGIQDPFQERGEMIGTVEITNKTIVTSGIYERYFEKDGKKYHHILNPFTGYPIDNSLESVTVVTDVSINADAMTKNIFYKGIENGPKYIRSLSGVEAIFVTKNKEVYITDGLKNNFKLTNSNFKLKDII